MKSIVVNGAGEYISDAPIPSGLDYCCHQHELGTLVALYSDFGLCYQGFHAQPDEALNEYQRFNSLDVSLRNQVITQDKPLHLIGTDFQLMVWQRLCKLSRSDTSSYSHFAATCQRPTAVRAIASAIARNPVAIRVPCHRILPKRGGTGQYRWGNAIKHQLLRIESNQF
ncbi:methylated-DNA--[protein]-cysteine S-methyltransferase [Bermanella marisrubri]|uniref:ADA regulatory protein n=1 Tax=Bermanella marisrubri TaxID=207949 RepID=Q1N0K1_9GAMM|nr:methylated-DNA--[protein]-cysteine S-methyltransferase [Bermanella marisrubri]EAT11832.1 ADA regulatory protein [Oceanobacter sp. RED65] [Bermanella marisrubri]QIZ83866.1 methylated-DNA--[protein]-cysteine S-methyltransferase [Bermanella marisrubri]